MMDYRVFRQVIMERIMDYMPVIYRSYRPKIEEICKVSEAKEALVLVPSTEAGETCATPMVYLDEMYRIFEEDEDLDNLMLFIANIFMNNIMPPTMARDMENLDFSGKTDQIVMEIIGSTRNSKLLTEVPHIDLLNLSVIYRFVIADEESGFGIVTVTNSILETLDMSLAELHSLARENTRRIFPPVVSDFGNKAVVVTNESCVFGSVALLYEDIMKEVGERLGGERFYIIPCSIHEFIAVPEEGNDLDHLINMLASGNSEITEGKDILSNTIYHYDCEAGSISKAASYQ